MFESRKVTAETDSAVNLVNATRLKVSFPWEFDAIERFGSWLLGLVSRHRF